MLTAIVNIDDQSRRVKKLLKFKGGHRYGDVLWWGISNA